MSDLPRIAAPIDLYSVDKSTLARMRMLVSKVSRRALLDGDANDMLLRVYLSGLYHGMELSK